MFAPRYFARRYFPGRYFPPTGTVAPTAHGWYIGNTVIKKIYLGNTQINKAYIGITEIKI